MKDPLQLVHLIGEEYYDPQKHTIDCGTDNSSTTQQCALLYKASSDLPALTLQHLMSLFETNMGEFYRNSSWGLDLKEKEDEFRHPKARFLLLVTTTESTPAIAFNESCEKEEGGRMQELAAFVHFRFCYDDDDQPEHAVVYVYEIQVSERFRQQGLGSRLMAAVESMAKAVDLPKVMLTVFKTNTSALQFYQSKLVYRVDR